MDSSPAPPARLSPREKLRNGARQGARTAWRLLTIIVPVSLGVEILRLAGILDALGRALAPAMGAFGLPGEAALALLGGMLSNLYASVAVMKTMNLTSSQATTLGLWLCVSHTLIVETLVLREAGAPWKRLLALRLAAGAAAAWLLHLAQTFR